MGVWGAQPPAPAADRGTLISKVPKPNSELNMKATPVLLALLVMTAIAVAGKVYSYKCSNTTCGYIESFETSKGQYKCPKCKTGTMSERR